MNGTSKVITWTSPLLCIEAMSVTPCHINSRKREFAHHRIRIVIDNDIMVAIIQFVTVIPAFFINPIFIFIYLFLI